MDVIGSVHQIKVFKEFKEFFKRLDKIYLDQKDPKKTSKVVIYLFNRQIKQQRSLWPYENAVVLFLFF